MSPFHSYQRSESQPRHYLQLEALEDRTTPASFTVSSLADSGAGSLREAINLANATAEPDDISFAPEVRGGIVGLSTFSNLLSSITEVPQPAGPSAFIVTSPIVIRGTGETITRSSADTFRLFQVTAAGNLTLQNLTLSNGLTQGGGSSLGGGAAGLGGAIYNQGTLTISGSTLMGNQATGGSGGDVSAGLGGGGMGGPSDALGNGGPPNGGATAGMGTFGGHGGFGGGGGSGGTPGNGGFGGGGGGGTGLLAGAGGFGGGGGASSFGGGAGGFGAGGGAKFGGGGGGGMGGAVFNQGGTVTIVNSTLSGNTARGGASNGNAGGGFGGGVFNLNGTLTLTSVTIAGNAVVPGTGGFGVAPSGGGAIYNLFHAVIPGTESTVTVVNSVLAGNTGGADVVNHQLDSGTAAISATGPNITTTAPVNTGGTLSGTPLSVVADALLGPLADNGGITPTMALLPGSPAVNAGSNAAAAGLTSDQRGPGFTRISNGTVDIGAFEVQVPELLVVSGPADGSALVFVPESAGKYNPTPAATIAPFGFLGTSIRVATGDIDGDGVADLITVTGPGVPARFAVLNGIDRTSLLVAPTAPFIGSEDFTGGGFVAVADFDRDGRAEIVVTPDQRGGPRVVVFSLLPTGLTQHGNFFGIEDPNFRGGVRPATGDVNGDGVLDLAVAAGIGGGPRVALFDGSTLLATPARLINDFFAFPEDTATLRNGAFVALGDVNGDGFADAVFGGGPGGAPRVFILSGEQLIAGDFTRTYGEAIANFFVAGDSLDRGGIRVVAKNADGDGYADVAAGSGEGSPSRVRIYSGSRLVGAGESPEFQDLNVFDGEVLPGGVFVG